MKLRGHLEDLGVSEILHVVGAARRSGVLRLQSGVDSWDVLFRDGAVVGLRGADMPRDAGELLVAAGLLDAGADMNARAQAATLGQAAEDVAIRVAGVTRARMDQALELEIERRLPAVLALTSGTFEFALLAEARETVLEFGKLVLSTGLPLQRFGVLRARPGASGAWAESGAEATGPRRAARLLVSEDAISLPGSPLGTLREPAGPAALPDASDRATPPVAAPGAREQRKTPSAKTEPATTLLHCLESGGLRQGILAALAEAGAQARAVTSLLDVKAGVEAARARGERVVLACHAGHPDLPGLEVLARLRSVDGGSPAIVLLDAAWPPARLGAVTDRARRLGARVVAIVDDGSGAAEAAGDLAGRILHLAAPPEPASDVVPLREASTAGESDGLVAADAPPHRVPRTAGALSVTARWLAAAGETAEIARDLLDAAGDQFDSAMLLVRGAKDLEPLGAVAPPAVLRRLGTRSLPADGSDFVARAVREGLPLDGPAPDEPADVTPLEWLDASQAARVVVLPLVAAGGCFGALVAADADPVRGDLALVSRFVMEAAPTLWEALGRERRRHEALNLRVGT